jgi:hypothetical protein
MLYKVLGMLVYNGAKVLLRRKYGPTYLPKPVFAGGVVAVGLGVALLLRGRSA